MMRTILGAGLSWKITRIFVIMMTVMGVLLVAIVYTMTARALKEQLGHRVAAIATNLSDAAAGPLSRRNHLELHALVAKYARLEGIAYATIENQTGAVIAHSSGAFHEAPRVNRASDPREPRRNELVVGDRRVLEVGMPVLEGQLGLARVGIWGDVVEAEIYRELVPLISLLGAVLVIGTFLFIAVARSIVRPILGLTEIAVKMSRGDLETPIGVDRSDELGELARSLERMRASLRAAMLRLAREHG
ncbi:MAG TPA: HAMP domain-containing protein [Candidatus Eisenbacteria bacterium]|nr:HAMP domain-containing protein [Candidatus Eisenbacteria bacterium]